MRIPYLIFTILIISACSGGGNNQVSAPTVTTPPPTGTTAPPTVTTGSGSDPDFLPSATIDASNLVAISAKQAAMGMGTGFNIGQMFENNQHPRTVAAATAKIDQYYALGYRHVRIPITWTEIIDGEDLVIDPDTGEVDLSSARLQVIEDVVDYALSLPDFYVVINTHHEKALKTGNKWWVLKRLWRDIATLFGNRNHRLIFELLNEPHLDDGNNSPMPAVNLRYMTERAYDEIRNIDPNRIIVIGGNQWFGASEIPAVWPNLDEVGAGSDEYLMATFHHYDPWSFNGDNQGDYADQWTDDDINSAMQTMQNWANTVGKGMPVYIGEWGTGWGSRYETMDCNNIRLWYEKFDAQYARSYGMPTTVWDDGGWFKIFDHSTNEFANNLHLCIIDGNCDWQGTERFNSACN
jgi:endoglucanase